MHKNPMKATLMLAFQLQGCRRKVNHGHTFTGDFTLCKSAWGNKKVYIVDRSLALKELNVWLECQG